MGLEMEFGRDAYLLHSRCFAVWERLRDTFEVDQPRPPPIDAIAECRHDDGSWSRLHPRTKTVDRVR
jgi:hypothetical protein